MLTGALAGFLAGIFGGIIIAILAIVGLAVAGGVSGGIGRTFGWLGWDGSWNRSDYPCYLWSDRINDRWIHRRIACIIEIYLFLFGCSGKARGRTIDLGNSEDSDYIFFHALPRVEGTSKSHALTNSAYHYFHWFRDVEKV